MGTKSHLRILLASACLCFTVQTAQSQDQEVLAAKNAVDLAVRVANHIGLALIKADDNFSAEARGITGIDVSRDPTYWPRNKNQYYTIVNTFEVDGYDIQKADLRKITYQLDIKTQVEGTIADLCNSNTTFSTVYPFIVSAKLNQPEGQVEIEVDVPRPNDNSLSSCDFTPIGREYETADSKFKRQGSQKLRALFRQIKQSIDINLELPVEDYSQMKAYPETYLYFFELEFQKRFSDQEITTEEEILSYLQGNHE